MAYVNVPKDLTKVKSNKLRESDVCNIYCYVQVMVCCRKKRIRKQRSGFQFKEN